MAKKKSSKPKVGRNKALEDYIQVGKKKAPPGHTGPLSDRQARNLRAIDKRRRSKKK